MLRLCSVSVGGRLLGDSRRSLVIWCSVLRLCSVSVGGRLLGDSRRSPAVGYLVLDRLCPALYALIGDGLLTRLDTAFGPVHNSVWRLVESVCPPGQFCTPGWSLQVNCKLCPQVREGYDSRASIYAGCQSSYVLLRNSYNKVHFTSCHSDQA